MRQKWLSLARSKAHELPRRTFLAGAAAIGAAAAAAAQPAVPNNTATSPKKGVGAWTFTGANQALFDAGVSWYYTWSHDTAGITTPTGVQFVPMIWGAADVSATALNQAKQAGSTLLGFNEPDNPNQSNMTVTQAISLWPQLMATGMGLMVVGKTDPGRKALETIVDAAFADLTQ